LKPECQRGIYGHTGHIITFLTAGIPVDQTCTQHARAVPEANSGYILGRTVDAIKPVPDDGSVNNSWADYYTQMINN
jgi:hypothetical protein